VLAVAALLDCIHDVQPRGCGGQYDPQALPRSSPPGRPGYPRPAHGRERRCDSAM